MIPMKQSPISRTHRIILIVIKFPYHFVLAPQNRKSSILHYSEIILVLDLPGLPSVGMRADKVFEMRDVVIVMLSQSAIIDRGLLSTPYLEIDTLQDHISPCKNALPNPIGVWFSLHRSEWLIFTVLR